jgi:sulfhydrogenase subunit beta (sulfur reductase)
MTTKPELQVHRLGREQVTSWLSALLGERKRVVAPVLRRGMRVLRAVSRAEDVSLDPGRSRWSAKEFLFPRTETLFTYEATNGQPVLADPPADDTPQVLFGVQPCDAAGLVRLDAMLLPDPFYARRRELTTVVAVACAEAGPECFCAAVGGSPAGVEGVDVLLAPVGEEWLVRPLGPKGEALVAAQRDGWKPAAADDWDAAMKQAEHVAATIRRRKIPASWSAALEGRFADPRWGERVRRCVGCSICTYVCPSCSCFDVADEGTDACGTRCRTWDSCSFRLFTQHGSGHNPRPDQGARSRQRVLHKFSYFPQLHDGQMMCVGCGRCVRFCPVGIDIHEEVVEILSGQRGEEAGDGQS